MIDDGLFEGLDAALLYHPCDRNHVESHPLASEDVDVVFTGLQSHASSDPWQGKNALDALILLFTSVGLWRQQLRPTARVHGIIREGGTAANIIPDRTVGLVHDPQRRRGRLRGHARAVPRAVRGGRPGDRHDGRGRPSPAVPGRCATTASWPSGSARTWPPTASPTRATTRTPARPTWPTSAGSARRSIPTSRSRPKGTPGHSILFRDAAATPRADEMTLLAATLVAQTAYELFSDPDLVAAAWEEFRATD